MNHLIDTNVLLAASAHVAVEYRDVTPPDLKLREIVYRWLDDFSRTDELWVVDEEGRIVEEYERKQTYQDFALVAWLDKFSRNRVLSVPVLYDADGYAELPAHLDANPWDKSDKKFVAAGLLVVGMGEPIQIVNSADTDWYDVAHVLHAEGIGLVHLIDDWCQSKYREKYGRDPRV